MNRRVKALRFLYVQKLEGDGKERALFYYLFYWVYDMINKNE